MSYFIGTTGDIHAKHDAERGCLPIPTMAEEIDRHMTAIESLMREIAMEDWRLGRDPATARRRFQDTIDLHEESLRILLDARETE